MSKKQRTCAVFAAAVLGAGLLSATPRMGGAALAEEAGSATPVPKAQFPRDWFWAGTDAEWASLQRIVGKPAPALDVTEWAGQARTLAALKGKIVLLDFWATWCGPCRASVPHTNAVCEKHGAEGVEVVAVCNTRGAEQMAAMAKSLGMKYPTAKDRENRSATAYNTPFFPFYVLIDRQGVVRAAGLRTEHVEDAVQALLKEQPPPRAGG